MEDDFYANIMNMDGKFAVRNTIFILIVGYWFMHISQYCTVTGIYQRLKYFKVETYLLVVWSSAMLKPRIIQN